MTKINQHREIPSTAPPVTHNSGGVRTTPAGGEVSRDQYQRPAPNAASRANGGAAKVDFTN